MKSARTTRKLRVVPRMESGKTGVETAMPPGGRSDSVDQEQPTNAQIVEMLREQQARVHELEVELKATTQRLEAELERQRLDKVALTSRVSEVEGGPAPQVRKLSRAGLLKAAAMGSAAVVGAGALGTLGAEHVAAATTDTNFIATGTLTNFDAKGTAGYAYDTTSGTFTFGGYLRGTAVGLYAIGSGATSTGLVAQGLKYGAELYTFNAAGIPLYLQPNTAAGAPTTDTHNPGEIYVDNTGRIFHCVTVGTPGTWFPLNALVPITPVRVLDTRSATHVGTLIGPYPTGTTLSVAIAGQTFATSSGTFTFPTKTIGVVGNLVAVTPTGAGYLVAYPQGATLPTAASVNFVPPGTGSDIYYAIGNNVTVALSASGQASIYMGLVTGADVQVVLDIAGYLV